MTMPISDPLQVHLFKQFKFTRDSVLSLLLMLLLILVRITGLNLTFEHNEIFPNVAHEGVNKETSKSVLS
jgi:hypothetical protein